jgi:ABC-type sugar transport system permease subunit
MFGVKRIARVRASEASSRKVKEAIEGYLYLAPTFIIMTIFVFIPLISSVFQISMNNVEPFGNRSLVSCITKKEVKRFSRNSLKLKEYHLFA